MLPLPNLQFNPAPPTLPLHFYHNLNSEKPHMCGNRHTYTMIAKYVVKTPHVWENAHTKDA